MGQQTIQLLQQMWKCPVVGFEPINSWTWIFTNSHYTRVISWFVALFWWTKNTFRFRNSESGPKRVFSVFHFTIRKWNFYPKMKYEWSTQPLLLLFGASTKSYKILFLDSISFSQLQSFALFDAFLSFFHQKKLLRINRGSNPG